MAEERLTTRDGPSSMFDAGYDHWERKTKRSKESRTRIALQLGPNIIEKIINPFYEIVKYLNKQLCISNIKIFFGERIRKNYALRI